MALLSIGFDAGQPQFVSISPSVPEFDGRAGGIRPKDFGPASVIAFEKIRVRVPFGHGRVGKSTDEIPGALALIEGILGIAALSTPQGHIRLSDGEVMDRKSQFHPYLLSWSIETRDEDGSWAILCALNFADRYVTRLNSRSMAVRLTPSPASGSRRCKM